MKNLEDKKLQDDLHRHLAQSMVKTTAIGLAVVGALYPEWDVIRIALLAAASTLITIILIC